MSLQTHDPDQDDPANDRLTELIGYLDGELDGSEMDLVEQRLINDPDMRSHADILSRTWALLDVLEEVPASQQFTKDTLASISTEAVAQSSESGRHRFRSLMAACVRYKVVVSFLVGIVGAASGLLFAGLLSVPKQRSTDAAADAVILENLDMLLNDDLYRQVPDVNALRALRLDSEASAEGKDVP